MVEARPENPSFEPAPQKIKELADSLTVRVESDKHLSPEQATQ